MNKELLYELYLGETLMAWLLFLGIILLGLLLRKPLSRYLTRIACRIGKTTDFEADRLLHKVRKPISNLLFIIICYVAFHQLSFIPTLPLLHYPALKTKEVLIGDLVEHLFQLLVIIYSAILLSRTGDFIFQQLIEKSQEKQEAERSQMIPYIHRGFRFVVWLIAMFVILGGVFHMNIPALIASLGIGGVALALAAKETVENTLASFIILVDKPFQIGETIKIGNLEGTVERIGFRSSRIRSAAQTLIIVPNKKLVDDNVENLSERGKQRLSADFALQYGTSKEQIDATITEIKNLLTTNERILPPTSVYLSSFSDNALQIRVGYFLEHPLPIEEVNTIREEINKAVYAIVTRTAGGFAIPAQIAVER